MNNNPLIFRFVLSGLALLAGAASASALSADDELAHSWQIAARQARSSSAASQRAQVGQAIEALAAFVADVETKIRAPQTGLELAVEDADAGLVLGVMEGSPAERAGIVAFERVVEIEGVRVSASVSAVRAAIEAAPNPVTLGLVTAGAGLRRVQVAKRQIPEWRAGVAAARARAAEIAALKESVAQGRTSEAEAAKRVREISQAVNREIVWKYLVEGFVPPAAAAP